MTTLLVPIKALDSAKSRLAERLSAPQRQALCKEMLEHVVQLGQATDRVEHIVLLSPCPTIRKWAQGKPLEVIGDPPGAETLAAVVDHGVSRTREARGGSVLVLMGDLPTLLSEDLDRMIDALRTADVVLAPDAEEAGTNGLGLAANTALPTCFGRTDSFRAHHARCRVMEHAVADVRTAGLAFDLDTVRDLDLYLRLTSRALATS